MKKAIAKIGALTAVAVSLSGCVGSNAVTGYVMGFNLKAVDNRYARGGLNMLFGACLWYRDRSGLYRV